MNRTQASQGKMFNVVLHRLEEHRPIWERFPAVERSVSRLRQATESLTVMLTRWPSLSSAMIRKLGVRLQTEQSILQIATVLGVWAEQHQDAALAAKTRLSPSGLSRLSVEALQATGESLLQLSAQYPAALADNNLTDADALASALETFRQSKTAPRQTLAEQARETARLRALFRDTSRLLRQVLDKQMLQFRASHRDFYADYQAARIVLLRKRRQSRRRAARTQSSPAVDPAMALPAPAVPKRSARKRVKAKPERSS